MSAVAVCIPAVVDRTKSERHQVNNLRHRATLYVADRAIGYDDLSGLSHRTYLALRARILARIAIVHPHLRHAVAIQLNEMIDD